MPNQHTSKRIDADKNESKRIDANAIKFDNSLGFEELTLPDKIDESNQLAMINELELNNADIVEELVKSKNLFEYPDLCTNHPYYLHWKASVVQIMTKSMNRCFANRTHQSIANGKLKLTSAPFSGSFIKLIAPPCASINSFEIARPNPVPVCSLPGTLK